MPKYVANYGVHLADLGINFELDYDLTVSNGSGRTKVNGIGWARDSRVVDASKVYSVEVDDAAAAQLDALPSSELVAYGIRRLEADESGTPTPPGGRSPTRGASLANSV